MFVKKSGPAMFSVIVLLLMLSSVQAVNVLDKSQEDITLILERGAEYEFPILLQDVDKIMIIKTEGDIDSWIGIWGDPEREIFPGLPYVLVTISVPDDAELGEYTGEITAEGNTVSFITVKVTPQFTKVIANDALSAMDEEVGALGERVVILTDSIADLRSEVAVLEHNVSDKVEQIYQYQKDLDALEKEKNDLEESYEELQEEHTQKEEEFTELETFTGAVVGTQLPGMFVGGIILGIIITIVIFSRENVKKKIVRKVKKTAGMDTREDFRYSYGGK
jgi:hypothetical protein